MVDYGDGDPLLSTIGVHVANDTRLTAGYLNAHRSTVQIGSRTEVTLFLDAAAIERLTVVLAEARELLNRPSSVAAA